MNNTFDFNRFSLLMKRQWVENKKLFLMASFGIMGILIVINSLIMKWETGFYDPGYRFSIFLLSLFFAGSVFANYVFKDLSDKNSSTSFLLVPASHFEKSLTGIFYTFIVFPIVFLTLFYVIDFCFVSICNNIGENLMIAKGYRTPKNVQLYNFIMNNKNIREILGKFIGFWLIIQAFVLAGTVLFEGRSYIKTAATGFALLFLIGFLVYLSNELFLDDIILQFQHKVYSQELIKPTEQLLNSILEITLIYVLPPILLVIAYFKLKEKQV